MYLSAWVGKSMVCPCKVQVVKAIVEDILLWGFFLSGYEWLVRGWWFGLLWREKKNSQSPNGPWELSSYS